MAQLWRPPSEARLSLSKALAASKMPLEAGWVLIQPEIVASLQIPERSERTIVTDRRRVQLASDMSKLGIVVADPRAVLSYMVGAHQVVLRIALANQRGDQRAPRSSVNTAWIVFCQICEQMEPAIPLWVKRGDDPPKF